MWFIPNEQKYTIWHPSYNQVLGNKGAVLHVLIVTYSLSLRLKVQCSWFESLVERNAATLLLIKQKLCSRTFRLKIPPKYLIIYIYKKTPL